MATKFFRIKRMLNVEREQVIRKIDIPTTELNLKEKSLNIEKEAISNLVQRKQVEVTWSNF